MSSSNMSLGGEEGQECPQFTQAQYDTYQSTSYWVEGVLCLLIAVPGFLGNIGSAFILSTKGQSSQLSSWP